MILGAKSILIVDDVPEILTFFQQVARSYKTRAIEVFGTSDPRAAILMLSQRRFDVVVSDFRMPYVDGAQVLAAARASYPQGRRVLMSGYNELPATPESLAAASITDRINKPVGAAALREYYQAWFSDEPYAPTPKVASTGT